MITVPAGLSRAFAARFGAPPLYAVRAPGRVNLIGEHTDYNGLPVFPMAIQRAIVILLRPREDRRVRAINLEARYPEREFELSKEIPSAPAGDWANYIQAAAQKLDQMFEGLRGMDAAFAGDIPGAAGLSSSSALVVASGIALLAAAEREVDPVTLGAAFADAEYYVGTRGGGMDQAISLGGRAGHAVRIDFEPLRLTVVPVPRDFGFLIAHSLVLADKSGSVREHYNARPREAREARAGVAKYLGVDPATRYPELMERYPAEELVEAGCRALEPGLARRFRHQVTEGTRVGEAVEAMRTGDLARFGTLMNASHASMRDDYEISCLALDELTSAAREAGAAGARLTGAGFGGCAVMLAPRAALPTLAEALQAKYYAARPERERFPEYLVEAVPSPGATIERIE
jgi:galactokinase